MNVDSVIGMATNKDGGTPRFNVSDALDVPLRGFLLRLRLVDGRAAVKDIGAGVRLRLRSPDGLERMVTVVAKSLTGGRNGQARLDKTGQIDVIIPFEEAYQDNRPIGIGWSAEGPLRDESGRPMRGTVTPVRHPRPRPTRDRASGGWPFNPPSGS